MVACSRYVHTVSKRHDKLLNKSFMYLSLNTNILSRSGPTFMQLLHTAHLMCSFKDLLSPAAENWLRQKRIFFPKGQVRNFYVGEEKERGRKKWWWGGKILFCCGESVSFSRQVQGLLSTTTTSRARGGQGKTH